MFDCFIESKQNDKKIKHFNFISKLTFTYQKICTLFALYTNF